MATMQAMQLSRYGHLAIESVPIPETRADEVLVHVAACGICGSDVHGYDGSSGRRIPPIIMGHEAAGVIAQVGADVKKFAPGDRVTFDSTIYCGHCSFCLAGQVNLCDHREVLGVSCAEFRRAGAFAEYVTVPERICYHLPDQLSFAHAAMLEAVSVALHAVNLSEIKGGEVALVIGAGMIGLLTMQAARAAGCSQVYVADVDQSRLELAKRLGATKTLHLSGQELVAECMQLTANRGVDIALEAVGSDATVTAAIESVRKGGAVTLIGNIAAKVSLPLQKIVTRQIRLQGSCASAGEYPQAMQLLTSGAIQVEPLITAVAPLGDGPGWFRRLHAREPNLMKVILDPRITHDSPGEPALEAESAGEAS